MLIIWIHVLTLLNERLEYIESLITSGAVPWISSRQESSSQDRLVGPNHLNGNSESMDLDVIIEDKLQRRMEAFTLKNRLFNGGAQGTVSFTQLTLRRLRWRISIFLF